MNASLTTIVRFVEKVDRSGECWTWTAATDRKGYGRFWHPGRRLMVAAHRFAFELEHGEQPSSVFVCHHCDNPLCVRPEHLYAGDHASNMRDMVERDRNARVHARKTHCPAGHPYDEANTYRHHGERHCRECCRARTRAWRRQRKAAA